MIAMILFALAVAFSLALALPAMVVCLQVLAASTTLPVSRRRAAQAMPSVGVLMPAHNEAAVIARSLGSIRMQLGARDRLLVVADNCDDDTARIAGEAGAEVIVRHDPVRRGKGYALDFGLRHLCGDPPDVVVVIDADCELHAGALATLAHGCLQAGRPVQALYLMETPAGAGSLGGLSAFAWLLRNRIRPLGMARFGLPCQLMGTGMAFPWEMATRLDIAHGGLVEDMQLGVDLALAGHPPLFLPEAVVSSFFPASRTARATQRARWEHGHLGMILHGAPRLLWAGLVRHDLRLLAMALDLAVPPLALLALLTCAFATMSGAIAFGLRSAGLALLGLLPLLLLSLAVGVAWWQWGRALLSWAALCRVPLYVAAKVPLYLRFLVKRQTGWVKTGRDPQP